MPPPLTGAAGAPFVARTTRDATDLPASPQAPAPNTGWTPQSTASGWTPQVRAASDGFGSSSRLSASVGPGTANRPADVRLVQGRLRDLGFAVGRDGSMDVKTARSLHVFTAILAGAEHLTDVPARIEPGSDVERRLFSGDAPRWLHLPLGGLGWKNIDDDHHDYGTDRLLAVLNHAGESYQRDFLAANPDRDPILSNDASLVNGGKTRDHDSHQTGLDLDLRLPSTDGKRTTTRAKNFDKEATVAMIRAFATQPEVERVLLADPLLTELQGSGETWAVKLVDGGREHRNHVHIDVSKPE